jgi:hypothetical protein
MRPYRDVKAAEIFVMLLLASLLGALFFTILSATFKTVLRGW